MWRSRDQGGVEGKRGLLQQVGLGEVVKREPSAETRSWPVIPGIASGRRSPLGELRSAEDKESEKCPGTRGRLPECHHWDLVPGLGGEQGVRGGQSTVSSGHRWQARAVECAHSSGELREPEHPPLPTPRHPGAAEDTMLAADQSRAGMAPCLEAGCRGLKAPGARGHQSAVTVMGGHGHGRSFLA